MLDIRKIKENPDAVKAGLKAKEVDCDAVIDRILELDVQVRALKTSTETKTAEKNKMAKENGWIEGGEYTPTNVQRESILNYPHLSAREMEKILYNYNLRYFLSPYVIWSHLRRFTNFSEFFHALKALKIKLFG